MLGTPAGFELYDDEAHAKRMVDGVCEFIYRVRPLTEWVPYEKGAGHRAPRDYLADLMPVLEDFRQRESLLVGLCALRKRRIAFPVELKCFLAGRGGRLAHPRAQADVNSRGCGPDAPHHVVIARPWSLATHPCWRVSRPGVIALEIARPSFAHNRRARPLS